MRARLYRKRKHNIRIWLFLLSLALAAGFRIVEMNASPVILTEARNRAHAAATEIMQNCILRNFDSAKLRYDELMHIEKDNEGNIILIIPNSAAINQAAAKLTAHIDEELASLADEKISVPIGVITGSTLLANIGPKITASIHPIGAVHIKLLDDFDSEGINQTRHRIWLEIEAEMAITVPFDKGSFAVSSSVNLCEGIIVGPVPDTYLHFNDKNGNSVF